MNKFLTTILFSLCVPVVLAQEKEPGLKIFAGPGIHFGFKNGHVLTNENALLKYDLAHNVHFNNRPASLWIEAGMIFHDRFSLHVGYGLPEKDYVEIGNPGFDGTAVSYTVRQQYADLGCRLLKWGNKNNFMVHLNWLYTDHGNQTAYARVRPPQVSRWSIDYHAKAWSGGIKLMYRKQFYHTQLDIYVVQSIFTTAVINYSYVSHEETHPTQGTDYTEEKTRHRTTFLVDPSKRNLLQFGIRFSYLLGLN